MGTLSSVKRINKYQSKTIGANVNTDATDFLVFNNLVVGKTYRFTGNVEFALVGADAGVGANIRHNGANVKSIWFQNADTANGNRFCSTSFEHIFIAAGTTVGLRTDSAGATRR